MYFDIKIGNKDIGRITIQLRADVVPMTAGMGYLCEKSQQKKRNFVSVFEKYEKEEKKCPLITNDQNLLLYYPY